MECSSFSISVRIHVNLLPHRHPLPSHVERVAEFQAVAARLVEDARDFRALKGGVGGFGFEFGDCVARGVNEERERVGLVGALVAVALLVIFLALEIGRESCRDRV